MICYFYNSQLCHMNKANFTGVQSLLQQQLKHSSIYQFLISDQHILILSITPSGKQKMNFAVTGRKMRASSFKKQAQDTFTPLLIQPKTLNQKVAVLTKPKHTFDLSYKLTQNQKQQPQKMEAKKQAPKKVEAKTEKKIQVSKVQQKIEHLPTPHQKAISVNEPKPKTEDIITQVIIRYNHYKDPFPSINGILSFLPIEQKYSFGGVFKGNFLPVLKIFKTNEQIVPETAGAAIDYTWKVQQNRQYRLEIQQDEEEEGKYEKKAYKAPESGLKHCACNLKTRAFHELTQEMKKLKPSELGGAKHRELLQQRDLEDVLFS